MKHINVLPDGWQIDSPAAMLCYLPKRALTLLPTLPDSRIGQFLPHYWVSADYSLPLWERQVQTEPPGKDEGDQHQAQEQ